MIKVLALAVLYSVWNWWIEKAPEGRKLRDFLRNWKTDWVHGIMVSISVFIVGVCLILFIGTAF